MLGFCLEGGVGVEESRYKSEWNREMGGAGGGEERRKRRGNARGVGRPDYI